MDERRLVVKLVASVAGFKAGMGEAAGEVRAFGRQVSTSTGKARQDFDQLGRAGLVVGAGIATGFAMAAKAAIGFESAFAGVRKTVDGTDRELAALSDGIRGMSRQLPATAVEIAGVAEAAGALGVDTGAILGFTRVMIDLGETTNLTSEQAATAFARIANVMGTAQSDFDRMGSTVVALGNNGASTEAEIVELANRLAAAGKIAGLTESNVFAFAETLASVGVEAEAGGTALSKVFTSVRDAVIDGSDKLAVFARVAGQSTTDFAAAFRQDAAGAITSFVEGLGKINDAGQSTTAVFESLELTDQRLMRALLSTGSAGDYLRDQINLANGAWQENNALSDEAAQRYETTAAQLEILRNNIVDLAISAGGTMTPAIKASAAATGTLLSGVQAMPGPLKAVAGGFAAVTGVVTAAGGGYLVLGKHVRSAIDGYRELAATAPRTATALRTTAIAATAVSGVIAAATIVYGAHAKRKAELVAVTNDFVEAMRAEREGAENATRALIIKKLEEEGLLEAGRAAGLGVNDLIAATLGEAAALRESVAALGDKGAKLIALARVQQAAVESDERLAEAEAELQYKGRGAADTMDRMARSTKEATDAVAGQGRAFADATEYLDGYSEMLDRVSGSFDVAEALSAVEEGLADFQRQVMDARVAGDAFATSLDTTTAAGRDNSGALIELVRGVIGVAEEMTNAVDANGNLAHSAEDVSAMVYAQRQRLLETAEAMGIAAADAVPLIDALLQIEGVGDLHKIITADTSQAIAQVNSYIAALQQLMTTEAQIESAEAHRFRNQLSLGQRTPPPSVLGRVPALRRVAPSPVSASGRGGGGGSSAAREAEARARAAEEAMERAAAPTDDSFARGLAALAAFTDDAGEAS